MAAKIVKLITGILNVNTYIVVDEESEKALIIDPGGNEDEILRTINNLNVDIEGIIATHLHFDHIAGVPKLRYELNTEFMYHPLEEMVDQTSYAWLARMLGYKNFEIPKADKYLKEDETIRLGSLEIKVILTPGHTPGSVTLFFEKNAFVGDVIFREGVGRTDFPGGDWDTLEKTIKTKIYTLPDDTVLHPGHGPETTVGYEKKFNPFVRL